MALVRSIATSEIATLDTKSWRDDLLRRARAGARVVTLYGRPGCHLCDEAREGLERLRADGHGFELVEVDIEADERLHREMLERIPVVEVDGALACELLFEPSAVLALLCTLSA